MKRASYRHAIRWIAHNDDPASGPDEDRITGMISVLLVADIFDVPDERVVRDVVRERRRR